jgi:fructose-1-phosphate kinase PfkB-like protein
VTQVEAYLGKDSFVTLEGALADGFKVKVWKKVAKLGKKKVTAVKMDIPVKEVIQLLAAPKEQLL